MKDERLYLIHIRECIERIERYTASGREHFPAETLVQDAVLRNLQTLAESPQRLSPEWKRKFPEPDWQRLSGVRNVLTHNYLGVNLPRVWEMVAREIPGLKTQIEGILTALEGPA